MKIPASLHIVLLLAPLPTNYANTDTPARKPNVLHIYSDDHAWADLGVQGMGQERDTLIFFIGYNGAPLKPVVGFARIPLNCEFWRISRLLWQFS